MNIFDQTKGKSRNREKENTTKSVKDRKTGRANKACEVVVRGSFHLSIGQLGSSLSSCPFVIEEHRRQ